MHTYVVGENGCYVINQKHILVAMVEVIYTLNSGDLYIQHFKYLNKDCKSVDCCDC